MSMKKEKPLILLSNDDGVNAKGLNELIRALRGLGEIIVMAPDGPRSGASGSIRDAFRADLTASIIIVNRKSKVKRSLQFFSNFCRFQAERPDSITLR